MSSGFSGINNFGNLTTQSGQKLTFEDFDKNKDGEVSKAEYEEVLKEMKLDSVELSTVDKNGDNVVSGDEFAIWEQKTQMQESVNKVLTEISKDPIFAGKTEYINEIIESLKNYIDDYANAFTGDISNMAALFEIALPVKTEEIKAGILANDPETVKSEVLDELYSEIIADMEDTQNEAISSAVADSLLKTLEAEANSFIKSYTGNDLRTDLNAHLEVYMSKSDSEKMEDAIGELRSGIESLGSYLDNSNDLIRLKEYAREFLLAALNNGVDVKLAGTNIKTEVAITTALNKYTDTKALKADLEAIMEGFSTENLKDTILTEEINKAEESEYATFTAISGSEYAVDSSTIDYSDIPGYFDGSKINTKGKNGHDEKIRNQAKEIIENSSLKDQMKQQITEMLEDNGVSFDKIESIFENVFADSLNQTLKSITSSKTNKAWLNKNKKYASDQDIKTIVDSFITNFNTNIAKAIDEMNASNTDLDTQNIDYSEIETIIESGQVETSSRGNSSEARMTENASLLCDMLQAQLLKKANTMCSANGIEFDSKIFSTMFNNAKMTAISVGVLTTTESKFFGLIKNKSSEINKDLLLNTLVDEFSTNFTKWVHSEVTLV